MISFLFQSHAGHVVVRQQFFMNPEKSLSTALDAMK